MKKLLRSLGFWIFAAMILGILVGIVLGPQASILAPFGALFMSLIKMLVIPLISVSIILGAASLGRSKSAGKIGVGTFVYYLGTTAVAVVIGLVLGSLFMPGKGLDPTQFQAMFSDEYANRGGTPGFWDTVLGVIPTNPFEALITGNILQILFFCIFLGLGVSTLKDERKEPIMNILTGLNEALIWMIEKVMFIAPFGVIGLMADAVGTFGYEILGMLLKFLGVYTVALVIQTFGVYPLFVELFSKMNPLQFLKKIGRAQMVAFSTSSSMATLPVTMEVCEEDLDVSPETTSFVLPLGATINMDGNAIYYALATLFFAQLFGVDLGPVQFGAIILTATLGSIGQAGVPGPSLLVVAVLIAAGVPTAGIPLLFGADRLFDMMRTTVNITGDASCAVIMDGLKEDGEKAL